MELTQPENFVLATKNKRLANFVAFSLLWTVVQPLAPTIGYLTDHPNIRYWHSDDGDRHYQYSLAHISFWTAWEYVLSLMAIGVPMFSALVYIMCTVTLTFWLRVLSSRPLPFSDGDHELYRAVQMFGAVFNEIGRAHV